MSTNARFLPGRTPVATGPAFVLTAVIAVSIPGRRAARIDPVANLKVE